MPTGLEGFVTTGCSGSGGAPPPRLVEANPARHRNVQALDRAVHRDGHQQVAGLLGESSQPLSLRAHHEPEGTVDLRLTKNDVLSIGGEYFYNSIGYADPSLYPGLLFNDRGTPMLNFFYTGRHYAALFASLPAPYSWNYTTFTLSTIGNLSDQSFVSRFDYSVTLLTHLTFEAFVAMSGRPGAKRPPRRRAGRP